MKLSLRLAAPTVLALALSTLAAVGPTASAETGTPAPRAKTDERLLVKEAVGGRAALRELGSDLGTAARRNQMTPVQLEELLRSDSAAVIYPDGRLAYVEERHEPLEPTRPTASQELVAPTSETFLLHSRPGSKRTIFLDFNGADVSDTLWNKQDKIPNGFYDGFSLDGDFASFNAAEHEYVQEVWRVVSEVYATFDVDVTTQDPGPAAYNRSGPLDQTYGDHVLFSDDPTSNPVCEPSNNCAGVAFVDTFDYTKDNQDYYEPSWVRRHTHATDAGFAAAHEIGHTLGLLHDGRTSPKEAYYQGSAPWSPIMGSGPHAIQQFSKGEYPSSSNKQDDLAVITAVGGLPTIPDEAGNTIASATTLGARATYPILEGLITHRSDDDVYKIGPCTNEVTLKAEGTGVGTALDLRLSVLKADGSTLVSNNPTSGQTGNPPVPTGVNAQVTIPAGSATTYYVKVDGVGGPGYTDYGSIGSYELSISGCVGSNGSTPGAPGNLAFSNTKSAGKVTWTAPFSSGSTPISGYRISGLPNGPVEVPAGTTSKTITVPGGRDVDLSVVAFNAAGPGSPVERDEHIDSWAPTTPPSIRISTKVLTATIAWSPGANPGGAILTAWRLQESSKSNDLPVPDFERGVNVSYNNYGTRTVRITPLMHADDGSRSPGRTVKLVIAAKPGAPRIKAASSGSRGRPVNAVARWAAGGDGGATITAYKVVAYKLNARGKVVGKKVSRTLGGKVRAYAFPLAAGRYRFRVVAYNVKGGSPASALSRVVTAR